MMEAERNPRFRKSWKYPLFLFGLAILVLGELAASGADAQASQEAAIAAIGLAVLVLSIALG
jgi:hypothetical protein